MIVFMVTLYHRVPMRRPTPFSAPFSLLKLGSAAVIILATALSCSEYSTSAKTSPDGVVRVKVNVIGEDIPDSVKSAMEAAAVADAGLVRTVPTGPLSTILSSPVTAVASASAPACGGGGAFQGYTKSKVAFAPEAIPNIAPYPLVDDGVVPDSDVPLGFDFSYQGVSYNKVNVYTNGFLLFGARPSGSFPSAGSIASVANPNNIIALAWTDWSPQLVADGIRWETRGSAPNRKFILQFNDVPEFSSASKPGAISPLVGRITSQIVLSEGSNDITIYTTRMTVTNSSHRVTQGLENQTGTAANFDSVLNVNTGIVSRRVQNFFNLQNDAVRFSLISTKDEEKPVITAPENITANNDPGLATAVVAVHSPAASDNCGDVKVRGARNDKKALEDPYPVGVTKITWTAEDVAGNTASATQDVKVIDVEAPVFGLLAQAVIEVNATSPNGAAVTYEVHATDNVGVTSRSCEPASGSVFPVGTRSVTCTAGDAAGNSSSISFSVKVIGAHEQIGALMQAVANLDLPNGTVQPLVNQLKLAYTQTGEGQPACKKVGDFVSMVQKKSSNIASADAAFLVAEANRIMDVMGCPPPAR
jgi:hypothetical protein